ncbi:MAG TPA: hypothetical protein VLH56_11395 [Dissulfurispiraceae bacterium]|nr:hypothetical protein [Dissulfurispiraceae bacterium]
MGNITALNGLCTSAGVAINAGTVFTPAEGQKFYALTGGKLSGAWVVGYDKGNESALLAYPHTIPEGGDADDAQGVLVPDAGTMNYRPAVIRMPADTILSGVTQSCRIRVENDAGHPMAMLHLDTETTAWASATGTVLLGYEKKADEPVTLGSAVVDVDVTNATAIPVTLGSEVVDVDIQNAEIGVTVNNTELDVSVTNDVLDVDVQNASLTVAVSNTDPMPVAIKGSRTKLAVI